MHNRTGQWLVALALALSSSLASAQNAKTLEAQAIAAYEHKDYATSAALFEKVIDLGDPSSGLVYDAACSHALAGEKDAAFVSLDQALSLGFAHVDHLLSDGDLDSLHSDPRWKTTVDRMLALHPEAPYQRILEDQSKSVPARYLPVRRAFANGLKVPSSSTSNFMQYYATLASMMGEYDEARASYLPHGAPSVDPVAAGFDHAVPANALILERARSRQAVFLNESHGEAQTRAANYLLLAPLRKLGFKYLALETLTVPQPEPSGPTACAAPRLGDADLPTRGYPSRLTGYYTSEPVYGEIIREALRLGYTLVSYDGGGNRGPREQHEAEMIACVLKSDPKARIVAIGGFGHISEKPDATYPGGRMGVRFKQLTGIDPLTVSNTELVNIDPATLVFPADDKGRGAGGYALLNKEGEAYGSDQFDLIVYERHPAHRNDNGGSWLELGGARKRTPVTAAGCHATFPCLLEAQAEKEAADAIPSDRCVIADAKAPGCNLYLRPGRYRIASYDENVKLLDSGGITVK